MAQTRETPSLPAFSFQRTRRIRLDWLLSRASVYGILAFLITVGYALTVAGISLVVGNWAAPSNPLVSGVLFFLLALLVFPLRSRLQESLDNIFQREEQKYHQQIEQFSLDLTHQVDVREISRRLQQEIQKNINPNRFHLFLFDPLVDQYISIGGISGLPTSDLRFTVASPLVQVLKDHPKTFVLNGSRLPVKLQPEQARIGLMQAQAIVPLHGQKDLVGWMSLGKRPAGLSYSAAELDYVENIAEQTALAVERALLVTRMEKRVQETNVLSRVAQGVNVTVALDDIFELIYAQTTQIISADDFSLVLVTPNTSEMVQVFYVQGDERLKDQENIPLSTGQGLDQEVINQQRALRTDDYQRECRQRNILSSRPHLYSWIGVPLNAGAETIGALAIGMRDPASTYSAEQQDLLQSIADQVAGAIVKARLLEETERRAKQLTTLNVMTRQLTSTLEVEPLLENILHSAVDILNCEAGSLLLLDEQTGELVFRVTTGPVASDLVNKRMPSNSGVAGKAVEERSSIIVNDVSSFPGWFPRMDQQTGFVTRALLVVPLLLKDRVIGVIEVINRRDHSSFSMDDENLLSAFAAQAAVAIENARLYTMTDQALAARVEELSVMQRIDRELNTSLDTSRAMRITLEWAMRQSGADAGLVGMVHEGGLQVMASQGYAADEVTDDLLLMSEFNLQEVVEKGSPQRYTLRDSDQRILKLARSRMLVPIQRESSTVGVVVLESLSPDPCPDDVLNFLMRLSDHASVAIANAQLYSAVQSANVAKSEFVSFVAHELKNPMTSIKGYTELLAAKAVGPINDAQGNFLSTIRSNIERMNTLVSDLNDLSKIEAGRLRLEFKATSLREVTDEVVRSLRKQVEEKEQFLSIHLTDSLPPVWADRVRLSQVLVNLVSNAYKYTDQGGEITIGAERCPNEWDASGAADVVHIWVKDSGIGINEEDQKKIFQKFFRSEDPKTREVTGTGLGLNITRSLVEMQGGKIWFESEYRKGTTFHFTIPVAEQ